MTKLIWWMKIFKIIEKSISHYKILEKPGEGGIGVVYRAKDTKPKYEITINSL